MWEAYNTASGSLIPTPSSKCDEYVIGEGDMGYWQSTDTYPDNEIFGELRNTPIRHPKMPDCSKAHIHDDDGRSIIILGVKFENIEFPLNDDGTPVQGIVGYRIVRGNRIDKSVLGKGLIFNMREYEYQSGVNQTTTGLFPNYPMNDLRPDPYLSKKLPFRNLSNKEKDYTPLSGYRRDMFTFHSPSTSFGARIALGSELKVETEEIASVEGYFEPVYGHPRHKILRNFSLLLAAGIGIGEGLLAMKGKTTYSIQDPSVQKTALTHVGVVTKTNSDPTVILPLSEIEKAVEATLYAAAAANPALYSIALAFTKNKSKRKSKDKILYGNGTQHGVVKTSEETAFDNIPLLNVVGKVLSFAYFFSQGIDTTLNVIKAFSAYQQYAYQYNSHGYFNRSTKSQLSNVRRRINNYNYLYPTVQDFEGERINNFKRESSVVIKLNRPLVNPRTTDNTRQTISTAGLCKRKGDKINTTSSAYYVSIKQKRPNQYGQLDSIEYLDTGYYSTVAGTSEPVFGGDTYISRFTQKRKMHFFNQTEFKELDGHEFDYRNYINVANPRYWMNTQEYEPSELIKLKMPSHKCNLDCMDTGFLAAAKNLDSPFVIKDAVMYLFVNGIIDFYCESPYNLDYREWEEQPQFRHYDKDTYTNLSDLFRHDYMDYDNRYLYDLSLTKQLTENYIQPQDLDYNPQVAEKCFTKYPGRVIYSLASTKEQKRDNWLVYLANNYYDFGKENGSITGIFPLNRFDILFTFNEGAPHLHRTIDEIQTDGSFKITVGDGGLFAREPQPLLNTQYDYGNCQSKWAFSNTHYGLFYPSQRQGRVFLYNGKMQDITQGMSRWFKEYLPSRLVRAFPDFKDNDNPVAGVGLISIFNPTDEVFYLSKKDYEPIEGVTYDSITNKFYYNGTLIPLGHPDYFKDASWTLSYNPKFNTWVSFHDWHPSWTMQTENNFITCKDGFWKHNELFLHHCNFYGDQYLFEVEFVASTGLSTEILGNVEYNLETYEYYNSSDKRHLIDYNFNRAIIHNSEQISGNLRLNPQERNSVYGATKYPIINGSSIDIEYARVEQKFRFNQFWDISKDITKSNSMFELAPDGHTRTINKRYVDYGKSQFQRKRFRHFYHKVWLKRIAEHEEMPKMLFRFNVTKTIKSPR
jgi:hypothetical protein